jgi:citrate lyase subunit beta/citryl-CoA lyase
LKTNLQNAKSWLFVPANKPEFLAKAASRGASVIIVDMEDAVPAADKQATRLVINQQLADIKNTGQKLVLRTNTEIEQLVADLSAIDINNIDGLMLPKLESADYLNTVGDYLNRLELAQGKALGSTALIGLIESPKAVMVAADIALASERLACLAIGSEDLALSLGVIPTEESLSAAIGQVILAAKNANVGLLAVSGSLAQFRDLVAYEQQVISAAGQGCTGALCIHPAQVSIVNQHYGPTDKQLAWANAVLDAVAVSPQGGVWQVDGAMVDAPVLARAKALIDASVGDK